MTRTPTGPQVLQAAGTSEAMSEAWCVAQMAEGRFVQVLPHLLILLARASRVSDTDTAANLLMMLGLANWEVERHHDARGLFSRALHLGNCRTIEENYHRIRVFDALSALRLGQLPVCAGILQELAPGFSGLDDATRFFYLLASGEVALARAENDAAMDLAGQVATLASREPLQPVHLIRALDYYASCHSAMGQEMKALDYYYRAISLAPKFSHGFLLGDLHLKAARLIGHLKQDQGSEIHAHERVRHPAWHLSQAQSMFFEYGTLSRIEQVSAQFREFGRRLSDRIVERHVLEPADQMARSFIQLADASMDQLHSDGLQMSDVAPQLSEELWVQADGMLRENARRHEYTQRLLIQLERLQQNLVTSANLIGVERNRLQEVLVRSQTLAQAADEETLITQLLQLVQEMIGADAVVFEPSDNAGPPMAQVGRVTGSWQPVTRKVNATRKRVYLALPLSQTTEFSDDWFRLAERDSARVMAVPVGTTVVPSGTGGPMSATGPATAAAGARFGVVYAEKSAPTGVFSQVDLQMLEALAMQASLLMSNFRTARQLNITRTRMETALDAIGDGVIGVDPQGRVTVANRAALSFMSVPSIIGKKLSRCPGKWPDFSGGPVQLDAHLIQLPAGEVLLTARPLLDDTGAGAGHILTLSELRHIKRSVDRIAGTAVRYTFDDLAGSSPVFVERVKLAKLAALSDVDVLIIGESGTGKEVFAQAIHNHSSRHEMPFVGINCAAIPSELLESELFGYEEGAFTGASRGGKPGKFELAEGGTILLDEIGDMPLEMQAKLLRVLEERRCRRVGGTDEYDVNVRVLSTTNRPLEKLVAQNRFRGDLLYRLRVIQIRVPALRERRSDVLLLAKLFLERYVSQLGKVARSISPEVIAQLEAHDWPGNVRELEHLMEAAVHFLDARSTVLDRVDFMRDSDEMQLTPLAEYDTPAPPSAQRGKVGSLRDTERESLVQALAETGGSATQAARLLGVSRATLYNMMQRFGVDAAEFRSTKKK
ncbi:sigma 54-interacting transcriptional regulator [Myxococcota bacterium]|nr:sigma 54-interacting transcriptional regulator [Myxococcota bacterium]